MYTRSARDLWGDERMASARASILAYLETQSSPARHSADPDRIAKSSSRKMCGARVQSDLMMSSLDAATTLAADVLDELRGDGLVVFYMRGDGLEMVRLPEQER